MMMPKETLILHPDALYDAPYSEEELDTSSYVTRDYGQKPTVQKLTNGIEIQGESARMRVTAVADGTLRIQMVPGSACVEPSTTEKLGLVSVPICATQFQCVETEDGVRLKTNSMAFALDYSTGSFRVMNARGEVLVETKAGPEFSSEAPDHSGYRHLARFVVNEDESIYGFGGRILQPRRNGTTVDIFTMKVGTTSGDYGGSPVPFFMSTKGYGFFLNNPWPHVYFDMGKSRADEWFYHAPGGDCDMFVFAGDSFGDMLKSYTELTGRSPFPHRWWLGFWCSSLTFETTEDVLAAARRMREEKYPCEAIVLDGPWRGGPNFVKQYSEGQEYISNDFDWHEDFGDGKAMIDELNELGYRVILHVNSRNFSPEATEKGLANGTLRKVGEEVVVRVLNDESEAYYESLMDPRIEDGVELWWTDHADRVSGSLNDELPSRNLFGVLWNRLVMDIMTKHGKDNRPCLTRGSGIGGQRYCMPWPGDTRVGVDAFKDDIWFCLNAGLAGFSLTSVDLAGFTLSKDKSAYADLDEELAEALSDENICRRLCQSIMFIPVPRMHNNWTSVAKFPWRCSEKGEKLYGEALRFRYELTPYFYHWAIQSSITGEPILRPMVYHNQHDEYCQVCDDQFYVGENMIFAPVTEEGIASRSVYLPAGTWCDWWSDEVYRGPCTVEVEAPLYELSGLPIFVKAGSVIPKQPVTDYLVDAVPEELTLRVFPGQGEVLLQESATENLLLRVEEAETVQLTLQNRTQIKRQVTIECHGEESIQEASLAPGEERVVQIGAGIRTA